MTATAKEAVGNVIEGQAGALVKEISKIDFSLPEGTTVIKF